MTGRVWPSREEWQAKAEYAVVTACTKYERLDQALPGAVWMLAGEEQEFEDLAAPAAAELRPLLTAEINRLRAALPDRPTGTRARAAWFVALEGQAYEDACNLGALEEMRRDLQRARRDGCWGTVCWHLGRIRDHYPGIVLPARLVGAHNRMVRLQMAAEGRRELAADVFERAAVAAEVARRATDEAWVQELERRARVDSPRVVVHGSLRR